MINTDRHGEKGKWRLSSLPRLPKTKRSFEEGCLSDTVHVGHPEVAQSVGVYLDDRFKYTAFTVPGRGLFQFVRMPFRLSNASATFHKLIEHVIGPDLRPHAFCYLDDIIVVNKTLEEHLKWLEAVLDKIRQANLTVNPEKCEFCRSEVKYLGYVVNRDGLSVNPEKTEPILTYLVPKNIKQLRRIIRLATW